MNLTHDGKGKPQLLGVANSIPALKKKCKKLEGQRLAERISNIITNQFSAL